MPTPTQMPRVTERYGKYTIRPEFLGYSGIHDDFDGAPVNSESGDCPDRRCFTGRTIEDVKDQIDEYEEEIA